MSKHLNLSIEEKQIRIREQKLRSYHKNKHKYQVQLRGTDSVSREQRRKSYHKNKDKNKGYYFRKPILSIILDSCKQRSKINSYQFELDMEYLQELYENQGGKCAVTGIEFSLDKNPSFRKRPFAPSLDRVDCNLGYIKSNVRFVCVVVNIAINEFGDQVFDKMCKSYVENTICSERK